MGLSNHEDYGKIYQWDELVLDQGASTLRDENLEPLKPDTIIARVGKKGELYRLVLFHEPGLKYWTFDDIQMSGNIDIESVSGTMANKCRELNPDGFPFGMLRLGKEVWVMPDDNPPNLQELIQMGEHSNKRGRDEVVKAFQENKKRISQMDA